MVCTSLVLLKGQEYSHILRIRQSGAVRKEEDLKFVSGQLCSYLSAA